MDVPGRIDKEGTREDTEKQQTTVLVVKPEILLAWIQGSSSEKKKKNRRQIKFAVVINCIGGLEKGL